MSTKKELLSLLRQKPLTVAELADELHLTRTAIATQLQKLVAENLVKKTKIRRSSSAGKPAQEYMLAPSAQDAGSKAYIPFVLAMLQQMKEDMSDHDLDQFLEKAGKAMAKQMALSPENDPKESLEIAVEALNNLGAEAVLKEENGRFVVTNVASCPLASAVVKYPNVDKTIAAFYSAASGLAVKTETDHSGDYLVSRYTFNK